MWVCGGQATDAGDDDAVKFAASEKNCQALYALLCADVCSKGDTASGPKATLLKGINAAKKGHAGVPPANMQRFKKTDISKKASVLAANKKDSAVVDVGKKARDYKALKRLATKERTAKAKAKAAAAEESSSESDSSKSKDGSSGDDSDKSMLARLEQEAKKAIDAVASSKAAKAAKGAKGAKLKLDATKDQGAPKEELVSVHVVAYFGKSAHSELQNLYPENESRWGLQAAEDFQDFEPPMFVELARRRYLPVAQVPP